jgi:hypothetical protein
MTAHPICHQVRYSLSTRYCRWGADGHLVGVAIDLAWVIVDGNTVGRGAGEVQARRMYYYFVAANVAGGLWVLARRTYGRLYSMAELGEFSRLWPITRPIRRPTTSRNPSGWDDGTCGAWPPARTLVLRRLGGFGQTGVCCSSELGCQRRAKGHGTDFCPVDGTGLAKEAGSGWNCHARTTSHDDAQACWFFQKLANSKKYQFDQPAGSLTLMGRVGQTSIIQR